MIKTKVAFLKGRLLTSQSEQFKKYSKSSDWTVKARIYEISNQFDYFTSLSRV